MPSWRRRPTASPTTSSTRACKKDDKVGLYCRNRIEIVIAMLGIVKAGAILVNVNFRYVEGELKYLFDNSDMVALVHERRYADRVANVLPETPKVKTILVVEDGSATTTSQRYGGVEFYSALEQGSPERDFGPRSEDDIYLLYTGGTTGFPKGVMWRHEDIYRVLFGGTDFATGEPIADEYDLSKAAAANPPMIRLPIPPMIHGATQSATWMSLFSGPDRGAGTGIRRRRGLANDPRAQGEPAVLHRRRDGAPAARRAARAPGRGQRPTTCRSLFLLASTAALFSTSLKEKFLELLPNRIITDSIGSSETGFGGTSIVAKGQSHTGGPRVTIDKNTVVLDEDGNEVVPGSGVRGIIAKCGHIPVGYFKDEKKTAETFQTYQRCAVRDSGRLRRGRGRRQRDDAGPRLGVDQQRRREDLPRRGRGRAQGPSRRVRRAGGRRARPALRPARRRRRPAARGHPADAGRSRRVRAQRDRGIQGAAQPLAGRRGQALARRASPTTAGPRTPPRNVRPTTCTPSMRERKHENRTLRTLRHRVPDLRLHPVGEGGRRGHPRRRARHAGLRAVQRRRRPRDASCSGWTRTPTASRTASTSSCPPRCPPRAPASTSTS